MFDTVLVAIVESLGGTLLAASITYVLGVVVAWQFHAYIFGISEFRSWKYAENYKRLKRVVYMLGSALNFAAGIPVIILLGPRAFFLLTASSVLIGWTAWTALFWVVARATIREHRVVFEFFQSSIALAIVAAFSSFTALDTLFRFLGW